jgi:sigma-B regulation protein RsbU (phosphoserine phosphatase)
MAIVQAILHAHPLDSRGPADLLLHANEHLCKRKIGGFVTAFLGVYEPSTGRMVYSSAGHPPPFVKSSGMKKTARLDSAASYPLGIDEENCFKEATIELERGDMVLFYTDGITEARGPDWSMFEIERLEEEFGACGEKPEEIIQNLRYAVSTFEKGMPAVDDQTLVVVKRV